MSKFVGPEKGLLGAAEPIWALSQLFATRKSMEAMMRTVRVSVTWNYADVDFKFYVVIITEGKRHDAS